MVEPAGNVPVVRAAVVVEDAVTYTPELIVSTYVPAAIGLPNKAAIFTSEALAEMMRVISLGAPVPVSGMLWLVPAHDNPRSACT